MSIYGIGNSNIPRQPAAHPLRDGGTAGGAMPAQRTRVAPATVQPNRAAPAVESRGLPVEAPEGTDPALWSILSSEERGFFARVGASGPLTYGRAMDDIRAQQLPASRGGRLDVKA